MQEPYKTWNINIDNIVYKNQKETKNKKIIFVKYEDDENLKNMVFQLPTLNNSIALSDNEIEIDIDINNYERGNKIIEFLNLIDTKVIKDAKIYANTWFSHVKDKSKINYHHILKSVNNDNYTLKLKIIDSKDFKTNLILNNDNENKLDIHNLPTDGKLKLILEFYAIWIDGNNFGILLRPVVISFINEIEADYNYKILEDSDSENDELFIRSTEINNDNVNLNLDDNNSDDVNSETSDIDDNNINNIIFNLNNLKI